jgi:tetratricopeptide (TPR) repeat protein
LFGYVLHVRGDDQEAEKLIRESLRVCQAFGDLSNAGFAFHALGLVEAAAGRYAQARACFSRSLAMARQSPLWESLVWSLNGLAAAELALGRPAEARRLYQESLAMFERPGAIRGLYCTSTLVDLGQVALASRDVAQAKGYFREALGPFGRAAYETAHAVEAMAEALLQEGDIERAAELLALVAELPATWHEVRQRASQLLRELEAELPHEAFAAAVARGRGRQPDDVVAELTREDQAIPQE